MPGSDDSRSSAPPSRPLRVTCYLDAESQGGSSTGLAILLGALDPAIEVTVMGTSAPIVEYVASARPGAATKVLDPVRSKFDVRAIRAHVRAVRELRPDILHVNLDNPWTSQYAMLAGVLTRTPVVSVLHLPTPPWQRRQAWLVRPVTRRVKAYICVSENAARFAESVLHAPRGWARVIHNGMPVPEANAAPGAPSPPGMLCIGAVGRLAEQKALHVLVEAMHLLPDCRLVLVGEGPERGALEALVRDLQVEDRVQFAGWAQPPWTATWAFDVLAMSSVNEGFPLVIVEAMLAGIPVVATAVGGIPEIVEPGVTGLLVAPGDPGALADALGKLAADPKLRAAMSERCRALATEQFTADVMAARYEALYREVLAGSAPD